MRSFTQKVLQSIESWDTSSSMLLSVAFILGLGVVDVLLERTFSYSFATTAFYLLPVCVATWVGGKTAARTTVLFATFVDACTLSFVSHRHSIGLHLVDSLMQFGVLFVVSIILAELRESFHKEQTVSRTDPLTGIPNLRGFAEIASVEIERMKRYGHAITAVYLDVDDFKKVNDSKGHDAGDLVLKLVALTLVKTIRTVDYAARIGGDEFVVLLPMADKAASEGFLARIKKALAEAVGEKVTFSIGAVTFNMAPDTVDTLLQPADAMMYAAKRSGKNSIILTDLQALA